MLNNFKAASNHKSQRISTNVSGYNGYQWSVI